MVAAARAFGSREPDVSVRNEDWMASRLMGAEELRLIDGHPLSTALESDSTQASQNLEIFEMVLLMLMRTRCIDELFQRALRDGIEEFVILGAGFDSRAYRFADELKNRRVIEIDFPTTQEWKKRRVTELFGRLPVHVTYAPIDFELDSLADVLASAHHDRSKPAFYLSEGLSMYLTEDTVRKTLRSIATNSAAGSTVVMEYVGSAAIEFVTKYPRGPIKHAVDWGEPWIFGVPDDHDRQFFAETGLELVQRMSVNGFDAIRKWALRRDGTFYGAHLTDAFKARAQQMTADLPKEDLALAARFGYWIGELKVP
jgi:methyltransferase (TIGR00027 family)